MKEEEARESYEESQPGAKKKEKRMNEAKSKKRRQHLYPA